MGDFPHIPQKLHPKKEVILTYICTINYNFEHFHKF